MELSAYITISFFLSSFTLNSVEGTDIFISETYFSTHPYILHAAPNRFICYNLLLSLPFVFEINLGYMLIYNNELQCLLEVMCFRSDIVPSLLSLHLWETAQMSMQRKQGECIVLFCTQSFNSIVFHVVPYMGSRTLPLTHFF